MFLFFSFLRWNLLYVGFHIQIPSMLKAAHVPEKKKRPQWLSKCQNSREKIREEKVIYAQIIIFLSCQISFVAELQRTENVDFDLCPNNLFCGMNGMYLAYISCCHVFLLPGKKWGSDHLQDLCTVCTFHFSRKCWFVPLLTSLHWVTWVY